MSAVYPVAFTTSVRPGATVDLSANMVAPASAGTYQGYWGLKNASGTLFGIGAAANQPFWVLIDVVTGSTTPAPGTGFDFVAQMCSASWSSGAGALRLPGHQRECVRLRDPGRPTRSLRTEPPSPARAC